MTTPDDIAARARAIHAARAEVDASLGLDSTPTTSGGVVPAAWLGDAIARAERAEAERDELRGVCDDLCADAGRAKDARDELHAAATELRERAEKAEAERDALRAAVREWFDADAAAEEAEEAATHAWGRASGPALDALSTASARRVAARVRLRALAGEGGR